jgi:hypothetical protein
MTGTPIDRLRRAVASCRADDDEDVRWLGDEIDRALGGEISLDEALGLGWASRLGARDEKIRTLHRIHFAGRSATGAAREIERLARRLKRSQLENLEQIGLGDPRRLIAEALATGLPFPRERQLLNIINALGTQ